MQTLQCYRDLIQRILAEGTHTNGRNGGTTSIFGHSMVIPMGTHFPLMTTKKVPFRLIKAEIDWFLSGSTNVKPLQDQQVHIWDEWADENGELGPIYGSQWRNFNGEGVDQIRQLIDALITLSPSAKRRLILSAWNPAKNDQMALPPCHSFAQFMWHDRGEQFPPHCPPEECTSDLLNHIIEVDCILHMRSSDVFLGLPFNIAGYAYLTAVLCANASGGERMYRPGKLIVNIGDAHIYDNHMEAIQEYLKLPELPLPRVAYGREDMDWFKNTEYSAPYLDIVPGGCSHFTLSHFSLEDVPTGPTIKAPVSK